MHRLIRDALSEVNKNGKWITVFTTEINKGEKGHDPVICCSTYRGKLRDYKKGSEGGKIMFTYHASLPKASSSHDYRIKGNDIAGLMYEGIMPAGYKPFLERVASSANREDFVLSTGIIYIQGTPMETQGRIKTLRDIILVDRVFENINACAECRQEDEDAECSEDCEYLNPPKPDIFFFNKGFIDTNQVIPSLDRLIDYGDIARNIFSEKEAEKVIKELRGERRAHLTLIECQK
ncbi:MAG: hypothetical protein KKE20_03420 [Nanoarchaeota archaeon]|nr:hypothetical protein [Nanoarchaeota archaeon]